MLKLKSMFATIYSMYRLLIFFIAVGTGFFIFPGNLSALNFTGFFNFTCDGNEDMIILESSLAPGVGSNDLGLDREKLKRPEVHLLNLADNKEASDEVKALVWMKIQNLKQYATQQYTTMTNSEIKAYFGYAVHQRYQCEKNPEKSEQIRKTLPPQGAPIGAD